MDADSALLQVLALGLVGLVVSVGIERFLLPRPVLARAPKAWAAHVGLLSATYALLVLAMGRPVCAMVATLAVLVTLVLVSNTKQKTLREPFLFQDYDYFLDTLRFPRLFLPFFGLKKFCFAAAFFVLALVGFWHEVPPPSRFDLRGQLGGVLIFFTIAIFFLGSVKYRPLTIACEPETDIKNLGLLAFLWTYAVASRTLPTPCLPFSRISRGSRDNQPHLVAVQSESFFDVRPLFSGIRLDVLQAFDKVRAEAATSGSLMVPAWGANTVRTEFSFLTGIDAQYMGVHRFNPYQTVARGWSVPSLPHFLKKLGYRTVCIHPYWARFYGRDRVLRQLGFDVFMDISTFAGARREGSYVADMEVGESILRVLRQATRPTFVFAITMENHGPLHLEPSRIGAAKDIYCCSPPAGCDELSTYLYHLRNADNMLCMLHDTFQSTCPASLCFYGDHVPIMPSVYKVLAEPAGIVPYFCWNSTWVQTSTSVESTCKVSVGAEEFEQTLAVHDLALTWLTSLGFVSDPRQSVT